MSKNIIYIYMLWKISKTKRKNLAVPMRNTQEWDCITLQYYVLF